MLAAAVIGGGLFLASAGAAAPSAPFTECPSVGFDTGCALLIYVDANGTVQVLQDTSQGPYEGHDDTLIGVLNDSGQAVTSVTLQSANTADPAFGFEGDGACSGVNSSGGAGFTPPPSGCPYDPNNTYSGPDNTFSGISSNQESGTVNFTTPLTAGGGNTWFSLEGQINASALTVMKSQPTLTTNTPASVAFGTQLSDSATLNAGASPTGTITFSLYGPNDPSCSNSPFYTQVVTVTGNKTYGSGKAPGAPPGAYEWVATYSGDANNQSAVSACGQEPVSVGTAAPSVTTTASAGGPVGVSIADSAQLSGGANPTGTITFHLYGPNDTGCTSAAQTYPVAVDQGNATYTSPSFTTTAAGVYDWVAVYSGDSANSGVTEGCGSPDESVVVTAPTKATPDISTTPAGAGPVGGAITDSALLKSGNNPTGTITFKLYGPNDPGCAGTPKTRAVTVSGNGAYHSGNFTPPAPGTYQFVALYSGDSLNNPAMGTCTDTTERVVMTKATPVLTTTAAIAGASTNDTAHLAGGNNPTGTISFRLFALNGTACGSALGTAYTVTVAGDGDYRGPSATPTNPGKYVWVDNYSGDPNNNATPSSSCSDAGEQVNLMRARTSLATQASNNVPVGHDIFDTATLSGGNSPTGTITFTLYGPGDTSCSQAPYDTSKVTVSGDGAYTSDFYTAAVAGTYRWTASYSGDSANMASGEACNAANESVTVVPRIMTGRAYAAQAWVDAFNAVGVKIGPLADTGPIATPDETHTNPCTVTVTGLVHADVLCASVDTYTTPQDHSVAKANVANLTIHLGQITNILDLGDITADVVDSQSQTDCSGSSGSTTITNLKIDGQPVLTVGVGPNTSIVIRPGVALLLDEQTSVPGGLMVNAIDLKVDLLGVRADVVVASATSDIHNC